MRAKRRSLEQATRDFQRRYLIAVLRSVRGRVTEAAKKSGRNRTELYRVFERLGIDPDTYRERA